MASGRLSKVKGKVLDIPNPPTIGTATAGGESVSIAFTAYSGGKGGPTRSYIAKSNPGNITATGSTSPINITGLTAGTSYTISVAGVNEFGTGEYSSASGSAVPTVATSYESIATTLLTGTVATVTLDSIPQNYKHLQIRYIARNNRNSDFNGHGTLKVNGSYGARFHSLVGTNSGVIAYSGVPDIGTGYQLVVSGNLNSTFATGVIDILDYANTNKNKVLRITGGVNSGNNGYSMINSHLINSTSAITSVTFLATDNSSYLAGSHFAIYGIKG